MIDINFLTPEYKFKLMFKNITRIILLLVLLIFSILFSVNMYLKGIIEEKNSEIAYLNTQIKNTKSDTNEIRKKMKEIPDLTSSIQIVEDIFSQQNLRISEILYTVQNVIPNGVWLYDLNYDGKNINFEGKAIKNKKLKLNSYENVFQFERNLKNTEKFIDIKADYIKKIKEGKDEVTEFKYDMQLKIK